MLDNRHHDNEDVYLSCRDLAVDDRVREFRLGSVSSYASVDSALHLTRQVSTQSKNPSGDADDDVSDCESDASGEYEPLRASSTSRLCVRSASPPPPLPPPRARSNSLNVRRPSTNSETAVLPAAPHFGEPPQESQSLGDLNVPPAEPAPVIRRKNFYRSFLSMHRPAKRIAHQEGQHSPKRFSLIWRRKSDRAAPGEKAIDDPSVTLNVSMPNLRSIKGPSAGMKASVPVAVPSPAKSSTNISSSVRSVSPGRTRISVGALHRALRLVQEHKMWRHRRDSSHLTSDNGQVAVPMTPPKAAGRNRKAKAKSERSEKETTSAIAALLKRGYLNAGRRRVSFENASFDVPDCGLSEDRLGQSVPDVREITSPVYELVAKPPSIVINCPEEGNHSSDRPERDCPHCQNQGEDEYGYVTMDEIQAILNAPPPALLSVPDADSTLGGDAPAPDEPGYLDMAGICRLRQEVAACLDSAHLDSAQIKPELPARPPKFSRDDRFSGRNALALKVNYSNLSDLHFALQALQLANNRAPIAEDEDDGFVPSVM